MAKVGDTVRFLNSVGGGRITRIDGQIAYVDDDGFETPVLLRECVVVATGDTFFKSELRQKKATETAPPPAPAPAPAPKAEPLPPAEETPEGERINLVIGFEPHDIKRLSETSFDAYIVNDSNYAMYLTVATHASGGDGWRLRFAGHVDAAIQDFAFELAHDELPALDRIAVQAIAFKSRRDYALQQAVSSEQRLDATKFARLHCFTDNPYFDTKVLAVDVVKDGRTVRPFTVEQADIDRAMAEKRKSAAADRPHVSKPSRTKPQLIEVDLHASALLDNLNGLSKADILNYQIDTFRKVMDENLPFAGRRIVFIHGKGEGVLRQALMKELNNRYKGHDVADASFREYGFGATQVTIRKPKNS